VLQEQPQAPTEPANVAPYHMPPRLTPKKQIPPSQLGKSQLVDRPKRDLFNALKLTDLPQDTKELADQLEITDKLTTLYDPKQLMTNEQRFLLREKVVETILEAYLDAESVQAEADREQGRLDAVRQKLMDKRDRAVNLNNATNFISSGTLNTIGSVLGFDKNAAPFPGNLNQMLSGVVSTGMSTYSLKQQGGKKIPGLGAPTMLAELFGRPIDSQTTYPESVWRFFHGSSPEAPGLTRAQFLERDWLERGHLDPPGSKRAKLKLDLACGVAQSGAVMAISDLSDMITMLEDVSTIAELMGHHLRDLLRMVDSDIVLGNE
jgi:hypothetical protein